MKCAVLNHVQMDYLAIQPFMYNTIKWEAPLGILLQKESLNWQRKKVWNWGWGRCRFVFFLMRLRGVSGIILPSCHIWDVRNFKKEEGLRWKSLWIVDGIICYFSWAANCWKNNPFCALVRGLGLK